MLQPTRTKFRKAHKGRIHGLATSGQDLAFGQYGLKAMEPERVTARQIEAARRALTRHMKRSGQVWIRVYPDVPVTKKPLEVRMGSGKGSVELWVCRVKPGRILFEVDGVPFGITICHEGWRYPEAVRWSAARGARLVFHPQLTGSDHAGVSIDRWGDPGSPYYEKAMVARSVENTIYFASVNCAMRYQDSATSLIGPDGECLAYVPYGKEQLLVHDIDLSRATGLCARRYDPAFYPPV